MHVGTFSLPMSKSMVTTIRFSFKAKVLPVLLCVCECGKVLTRQQLPSRLCLKILLGHMFSSGK
jgi:hypothetical protein